MIEIAASLADSVICIWFITGFLGVEKRKRILALPAVAVYFILTLICDRYLPGFNVAVSFILLVPAVLYALFICEKHYVKALIACSIYKVVIILSSSMLFSVISFLIKDFAVLMQGSDATVRIIYLALHKIVIISVLSAALALFRNSNIRDVLTGMIVFGTSVVTIIGLGSAMIIIADSDVPTNHIANMLLVVSFVAVNVGVYVFVGHIKKLERQTYELKMLEERSKFQQQNYAQTLGIWEKIKKIRHDINNQLIIVKEKLDSGKIDECREYVDSLIPGFLKPDSMIRTGNDILDYMINSKLGSLENTSVYISGAASDLSDIPERELVSLFGNIIDNMAQALEKTDKKRIELRFSREEDNRVMVFSNSTDGKVLSDNEKMMTTKTDREMHGYGHIIIEEIVDHLNGMVQYTEKDGMFSVHLIIPIQ